MKTKKSVQIRANPWLKKHKDNQASTREHACQRHHDLLWNKTKCQQLTANG